MTKTAEQIIREWIEVGDTEAPLDLDKFETIPELPASLKILSANSATSLPDPSASLVTLRAASARYFYSVRTGSAQQRA